LTPLIGREEELDPLLSGWQLAASGEGQMVLLSGEPGIGKSRLTVVLQERLQAQPYTCLRYFCSPHHQHSALHAVICQLERGRRGSIGLVRRQRRWRKSARRSGGMPLACFPLHVSPTRIGRPY
jgi:predicted ATPase